jgi:4-hydroxybenzoate polyprenyltransferase/phosphoserine phosphatase
MEPRLQTSQPPPEAQAIPHWSVQDTFVPLCVDLDGTLVKSDTLVDSVLVMARQSPRRLLRIPGWLQQGKAAFKQHVTATVKLDVAALPYNAPLLEYLFHQHASGRKIYLATAADRTLADRVAIHLPIFAGVLASDGSHNLAGENKLTAFHERFGNDADGRPDFAYIGNSRADLPLLRVCHQPMVANPDAALLTGLRTAGVTPVHVFRDSATPARAWLRAIRLHQWAKNTLVFLPPLLAHAWTLPNRAGVAIASLLAFLAFGLCASATYILNDLLDIEADRRHHSKRRRPFAAGDLSAQSGVAVAVLFLLAAFALAFAVPHTVLWGNSSASMSTDIFSHQVQVLAAHPYGFAGWLLLYGLTTTAYSFALKRVVLVDVIVLSGLYTVRILAGSAATGIEVSTWLAGFAIFFFLSLAFIKRFAEMDGLRRRDAAPTNGRGYLVSDTEQLRAFGTAAGYASVVVLTLYISELNTALYSHPGRLWLLVPVLLLWISRLWLLASRGDLNEDPVVYAITDRNSLLIGALVALVVVSAL